MHFLMNNIFELVNLVTITFSLVSVCVVLNMMTKRQEKNFLSRSITRGVRWIRKSLLRIMSCVNVVKSHSHDWSRMWRRLFFNIDKIEYDFDKCNQFNNRWKFISFPSIIPKIKFLFASQQSNEHIKFPFIWMCAKERNIFLSFAYHHYILDLLFKYFKI